MAESRSRKIAVVIVYFPSPLYIQICLSSRSCQKTAFTMYNLEQSGSLGRFGILAAATCSSDALLRSLNPPAAPGASKAPPKRICG